MRRSLASNIASNWVGYGAQIVIAFILTPYILHSLGQTRYGVWTLVMSLTGYYGLLDFGFSAGITQYLTRYLAAGDVEGLNRTASTGVVTLTFCGVIVFVCSIVLALCAPALFTIPSELTHEVTLVIAITGVSVAAQFAFFTYSAVFIATHRFDLSNAIGVATRLLSAAAVAVSLKMGYGLVGLSVVIAGTNVVDYLIRWRVSIRLLPMMRLELKLPSKKNIVEVGTFSLWNFVLAGSSRLIWYTDTLVIAAFMPVAAIAPLAVAGSVRAYFDDVFVRAGYVFAPLATELDARGERDKLRKLYLANSKFMFLGTILCGCIAILWASDFFRLWLGTEYAEPSGYQSVAILFELLLLASMVSHGQRIGYQVLHGTRQIPLLAVLFAAEGISNLLLSVALINRYGLIGVALGTLIPAVIVQGCIQPFFVCRLLQISLANYLHEVLWKPALVLLSIIPIFLSFHVVGPKPDDWARLFLSGLVSGALGLFVVLFIGLNRIERNFILVRAKDKN